MNGSILSTEQRCNEFNEAITPEIDPDYPPSSLETPTSESPSDEKLKEENPSDDSSDADAKSCVSEQSLVETKPAMPTEGNDADDEGRNLRTGCVLLRGGTITLSMSHDVVGIESEERIKEETKACSTLTALFEQKNGGDDDFPVVAPSSGTSSFGMSPILDESDSFDWDELGRMMSSSSTSKAPISPVRRQLTRSPSECVFQERNTETKTVTLNRQKKGYGFRIKGDGPVWISEVDKGSQAEASGLQKGGILVEVNGRNVEDVNHDTVLKYIMQGPQPLTLTFRLMRNSSGSLSAPVMSGYLTKQGGSGITFKNWRRRWFVLRKDGCLYYYKTESDTQPLGAIVLQGYTVTKALELDKKWAFKLVKGGARTYYLITESEAEMNSWAKILTVFTDGDYDSAASAMGSSAHNVSAPALSIRDPDCHGWLFKQGFHHKSWKKRYCVLKSGCLYYYLEMTDQTAKGVMRMKGYKMKKLSGSGKKHLFMAEPPATDMRPFYFYTTSELEYRRWFSKMEESILHCETTLQQDTAVCT